MSSPQKRKAEEPSPATEYNWQEWREYDKTAKDAVKDFHGVESEIPEIKCVGDSDGTSLTTEVSGCAPGKYNQTVKVFCDNVAMYMPSSGGEFPQPKKISVKMNGEEGAQAASQLKERLATAIASAENLSHFVTPIERKMLKKMSHEERKAWVVTKINERDYTIPVAQTEEMNEETEEIKYDVTAFKARSGFTRTAKGATPEELTADIAANLTNDAGVLSVAESLVNQTFSPPRVSDAIGNTIEWSELTEGGTKTRVRFAGILEIQLLGLNKITQKTTSSKSFATIPTKISSIRVCRLRSDDSDGPKIDPEDKRVKLF